jgi:hypothetical protein
MDMIGFHRVVESSVSFFVSEMGFCGDRMHEGWVGVRVGVGDCCGRACRVCMDLLDGLLKSGYVMAASERMIFLVFTKVEVAMEP